MTRSTAQMDTRIDDEAQDWFLRLTSGNPDEVDLQAFTAWCDEDPRHLAVYREIATLWGDLEALRPKGAEVPVVDTIVRPDFGQPRRRRSWSLLGRGGFVVGGLIAASLLLLFTGTTGLVQRLQSDYATGTGQQQTVTLSDGSRVYLNTDSAVAIDYSDAVRQVRLLRGEALFEVQKNPARPFDVLALGGRVTAVGTAFAVKTVGEVARVAVTEGVVRVAPASQDRAAGTLVTIGQSVTYRSGEAPSDVLGLDPADASAWQRGQIVIRNQSLTDALAEVGRYHPGKIILMAGDKKLQPVTARISMKDTAAGIDTLAATQGLSVMRVTDYLTVLR